MSRGQTENGQTGRTRGAERAVVLQILRDDHDECWPRAELAGELGDYDGAVLDGALARLKREDVLCVEGMTVRASRAARHLDRLGLIGV